MSKEDNAAKPEADAEGGDVVKSAEIQDWFLEALVDEANMRNGEFIGITLQTGGAIISGMLVGSAEYFKGVSFHFRDADEEPDPDTWGEWLLQRSEEFTFKDDEDLRPASYIHLRDARVFNGSHEPIPSNEGIWWRGRISSIDAFWLGRLKGAEPVEDT